MAKHNQSSLKRSKRAQQRTSEEDNAMYDATYSTWGAVKRIRTPHPHDVLSGRGGGINMHAGNTQFRAWVAERKNDYNLAVSKQEKAQVAREVIELVQAQDPPGRFLIKDPTSTTSNGWWVEADDEKVMAKTSQALREGAPQIRAAHRDEIEDKRAELKRRRKEESPLKQSDENIVHPADVELPAPKQLAMNALKANAEAAMEDYDSRENSKRVRIDYQGQYVYPSDATPPLSAADAPTEVDTLDLPASAAFSSLSPLRSRANGGGLTRNNSLALSEFSVDLSNEEFVNPFDDERDVDLWKDALASPRPRPGIYRESSIASDNGGLGALFRSNDSHQSSSSVNSLGVRSWNSVSNTGSRPLSSVLPDLPKELSLGVHDDFYEEVKSLRASLEIDSDPESEKPRVAPWTGFPHFRRVPNQLTRGLDGRQ